MLKGEIKKKRILETAEKLFFEKGYSACTIDDLLTELGTSKGSLYHHFESKQQILTAICQAKVSEAYDQYAAEDTNQALHALNRLLYYALPTRKGQEKFIATLLPLMLSMDGDVVIDTFTHAEKQLFFPEFKKLLETLQTQHQAFYNLNALPDLLFTAFTQSLEGIICASSTDDKTQIPIQVSELLQAMRFIFERCLDLPYGSMDIISLDELLFTLNHAIQLTT